jgi:adenosylmethionine-8-amino-7-oxononanoate aminotransferase
VCTAKWDSAITITPLTPWGLNWWKNGLIMRAVRDTMIISPPLVISREQIDELAEKAWRCLDLTLERCRVEGRL